MIGDLYIKASVGGSVGAKLQKTGQTTSYRTGDDGDLEAGREASFLVLGSNNPFGNTTRFTSELGTQTYTNNIVIDWSTFDGSTVLGWDVNSNNLGYGGTTLGQADNTWNSIIDGCLSWTKGSFVTGWRCPNLMEMLSVRDFSIVAFNNGNSLFVGGSGIIWTSTTNANITANAFTIAGNSGVPSTTVKTTTTASYKTFPCRTFTVTGTTLT